MRSPYTFVAIVACAISCGFSILAADKEPRASENPSQASPSATVQAEEKTEAQTSPKGTFKIESKTKSPPPGIEGTDVADFVVSTTDPKVREPLDDHPDTTAVSYIISPDEKWIYEEKTYGHLMKGGELYEHGKGLKFRAANKSQSFAEMAWRFFAKEERVEPDDVPSSSGGRDCCEGGLIDFVAWSPDSGRLLVDLRARDFGGKRDRGVHEWYVYFNTKTGKLELTDYLRRLNKGAWKRFKDEKLRENFGEAASAEPLGELPSEAESKKHYEAADRRVKESFQKLLDIQEKQLQQSIHDEQTSPTQRQIFEEQLQSSRDMQRSWIKTREIGAKLYVDSGNKSTAARRYWQYMADSTEARASEIERELEYAPASE